MNTSKNAQESAQDACDSKINSYSDTINKRKKNRAARKLSLLSKSCTKSKEPTQCATCRRKDTYTWLFRETSQGPINLCSKCKRQCLENSFGHKIQEEKRLSALKNTLKELEDRRKKLPPEADDTTLKQAIHELSAIIKLGPRSRSTWSPILSGSYEFGKRR